ncbi:MAG: sensor histidine kinase [Candidatus Hodarchaeales archaeon]
MFDYPLVEGALDFTLSVSVFLCLICYILFLFLESGEKFLFYLMILLLTISIIVGGIVVGLILITTGSEESFLYYLLAIGGTIAGSMFGIITSSKTVREKLFPVQDRLLMRRGHLKYVGGGVLFISLGSFVQLLTPDIPEMLIATVILICIGVFLFFISIAKTREHLREVSLRIIENKMDDLREIDQIKDRIIDISSHEMRTPIAVIKGHFDLLSADERNHHMESESREKSFKAIKRNIGRIERSFANIYDFSAIRREVFNFHFENANLINVINNTINDIRRLIEQKGLSLSVDIENVQEPVSIKMDPVRISQVVRNLLENAIKYSVEGEITVQIKETIEEYIVSVIDQGVGIDENIITTIFDPFKRYSQTAINVKGLGLGLFISKSIIEGHNGRIWANSEGKGSQFYFSLPKNTISWNQ